MRQEVHVHMCANTALAGPACLNNNAPLRRGRTYLETATAC